MKRINLIFKDEFLCIKKYINETIKIWKEKIKMKIEKKMKNQPN